MSEPKNIPELHAEIGRLQALLHDWQEFATDPNAADNDRQEWLDTLRARTEEVLKP